MSLGIPTSSEILERMRSDSQSIVPELNPGLSASLHRSLLTAFAGGSFEQFIQLVLLIDELFIDTAMDEFLERWGTYKGITRNAAARAQGFITVSGVDTTIVPIATSFSSQEGFQYETLSAATITAQMLSVSSITRAGNVATATTPSDHELASGISVVISGADQSEYNGTFTITVTGSDEFTYTVTGSPTTPATGTIVVDFTTSSIEIQSNDTGLDQNQLSGVGLTVDTAVPGMDDTAFVQFDEIGGGTDVESNEDLRSRILDAYQNPFSLFNVAAIERQAKLVPGVTRVFVEKATPAVGQVTIYFTRDNDLTIIPSPSEVAAVFDEIVEIAPAHVAESDIIVSAPTGVVVDFTFSFITPSTPTMLTAVTNSLKQLFLEKITVGVDIKKIEYDCAINDTIDTATGDVLTDFSLSAPLADITINPGEIGILGTVS